jgi:hypothetical protein
LLSEYKISAAYEKAQAFCRRDENNFSSSLILNSKNNTHANIHVTPANSRSVQL